MLRVTGGDYAWSLFCDSVMLNVLKWFELLGVKILAEDASGHNLAEEQRWLARIKKARTKKRFKDYCARRLAYLGVMGAIARVGDCRNDANRQVLVVGVVEDGPHRSLAWDVGHSPVDAETVTRSGLERCRLLGSLTCRGSGGVSHTQYVRQSEVLRCALSLLG
ncbi:MAG: hypothetical protein KatS3mg110_0434 [Pirellulaceae bacterium]|nr:MAG: hypothetical protein KatS3mg110_0434 [Pirellulaceae bacterium]